jgi:intracellular sulfur oxidation DsrE/DsrF family protein
MHMAKRPTFNRRRLLRLGAFAALSGRVTTLPDQREKGASAAWLHGIGDQAFLNKKAAIRQMWDFVTTEQLQAGTGAMKNAMNAFESFYHESHYLVIGLRGATVIYGLDDTLWARYRIGDAYGIRDATGVSATRNPLYARQTSIVDVRQDDHLAALQQRGAVVVLCHDALASQANVFAKRSGQTADVVLAEFTGHLVPGARLTPAGSALIAVAQQLGFTYAKE